MGILNMLFKVGKTERGASDGGTLITLLVLAILASAAFGILNWVESVKNERMQPKAKANKSITSPYHEPGAFKITF